MNSGEYISMAKKAKANLYSVAQKQFRVGIQAIKFAIVGAIGFVVDMAVVTVLFLAIQIDIRVCAIMGFLVALTANYFLNRAWTFKKTKKLPVLKGLIVFGTVCLSGLIVRLLMMEVMLRVEVFTFQNFELVVNMLGIIVGSVANFIGSKIFVFKD